MCSLWRGMNTEFSPLNIKHKYYVYCVKTEDYLEPVYIGKGSGYRAKNHKKQSGNKALSKLLAKYDKYYIEILSSSDDENVIFQLEKSYISKFGKIIDGGKLLNFSDGGRNTAESYFAYKRNRLEASNSQVKLRGKYIFVDGFIFPSKRFAARILNTDRNHLKYLEKIGRAFDISEDWELKNSTFINYVQDEVTKYINKVKKSSVQRTTNRAVVTKGVIYGSLTEAARETGVSQSAIGIRIKRGNQKETYYLDEYNG